MSIASTTAVHQQTQKYYEPGPAPLPMLIGLELRKATDTRAGRWLLGIIVVIGAAAAMIPLFFLEGGEVQFGSMLGNSMVGVAVLLPIVALMMVTTEWSGRSAMTTFTLVPKRGLVYAAKLIGALVLCLATMLVVAAVAVVIALIGSAIVGSSVNWSDWYGTDQGLTYWGTQLVLSVLMAFGIASVLASTPLAIVVYLVVQSFLDVALSFALHENAEWVQPVAAMMQVSGPNPGDNLGHSLVALSIWILLPLVIGAWLWKRREAK